MIGAAILLLGFYAVLWGKAQEEKEDTNGSGLDSSREAKTASLLQNYTVHEDMESRT